jgi:hypothetical protein
VSGYGGRSIVAIGVARTLLTGSHAFQACLIGRSSISPSLESTSYGSLASAISCDCDKSSNLLRSLTAIPV